MVAERRGRVTCPREKERRAPGTETSSSTFKVWVGGALSTQKSGRSALETGAKSEECGFMKRVGNSVLGGIVDLAHGEPV